MWFYYFRRSWEDNWRGIDDENTFCRVDKNFDKFFHFLFSTASELLHGYAQINKYLLHRSIKWNIQFHNLHPDIAPAQFNFPPVSEFYFFSSSLFIWNSSLCVFGRKHQTVMQVVLNLEIVQNPRSYLPNWNSFSSFLWIKLSSDAEESKP